MLKALAEQHHVGRPETVIRITAQCRIPIDVPSAERRLEVEWHSVITGRERKRGKETKADAAFQISCSRFGTARVTDGRVDHAIVGAVRVARHKKACCL